MHKLNECQQIVSQQQGWQKEKREKQLQINITGKY